MTGRQISRRLACSAVIAFTLALAQVNRGGAAEDTQEHVLAFSDGRSLLTVGVESRTVRRIASGALSPAWSPDGWRLAYVRTVSETVSNLVVANADGTGTHVIARDVLEALPSWSPDGRQIAFERCRMTASSERCALWIVEPDGHAAHPITHNRSGVPVWSPDSRTIVFGSLDRSPGLYAVDVEQGRTRRLMRGVNAWLDAPAWSPDGREIAFTHWTDQEPGPTADVYVVQQDGSQARRVSYRFGDSSDPAWSPDGSQLAFVAYRKHGGRGCGLRGGNALYTLSLKDHRITRLTDFAAAYFQPAWAPDGSRIAVLRNSCGHHREPKLYLYVVDRNRRARRPAHRFHVLWESGIAWRPRSS